MICLNCGYCCVEYSVMIINPKYIDEKFDDDIEQILIGLDKNIESDLIIYKESGIKCPHLYNQDGKLLCKIHNKSWYKLTPCFNHTQIETSNSKCRLGQYIINNNKNQNYLEML